MIPNCNDYIKLHNFDVSFKNPFLENIKKEFIKNAEEYFYWREQQEKALKEGDLNKALAFEISIEVEGYKMSVKKELYNPHDYHLLIEVGKRIIEKNKSYIPVECPKGLLFELKNNYLIQVIFECKNHRIYIDNNITFKNKENWIDIHHALFQNLINKYVNNDKIALFKIMPYMDIDNPNNRSFIITIGEIK